MAVLVNFLFILVSCVIMFLPIILVLIFNVTIFREREYFTLSVYGLYVVLYMTVQMVFAYLNRRRIQQIHLNCPDIAEKYNVLVVGYREDPALFTKCLASLTHMNHADNINQFLIVVDGNEPDDAYMADIARQVIDTVVVVHAKELLSSNPESFQGVDLSGKYICILQPHKGKRHALYTGLKLSCLQTVHGVMCSDSDTELDPNSLFHLANLLESDPNYGAVTGNVQIINDKSSVISYLSSLRYWFACNLERAYQSYNHCVLCVSGPLGVYRVVYLQEFLEKWLNQSFMAKECTYGDDRHLTNNMLLLGKKIGYTHLAQCYTESPETLHRFFTQQIRWCKSSLREFLWNVRCLGRHSLWMTIDLIYQTIYSFVVLGSLVYILYFKAVFQMTIYFATLLVFNFIKGVYAAYLTRSAKYLLFTFYGIVYIAFLAPAKLYAGMTLSDVDWGTSARLTMITRMEIKHLFLFLWNAVILGGIVFNLVSNYPFSLSDTIALVSVAGYLGVIFILLYVARY